MNTAWKTLGLFALALALAGCGPSGPKLYKAGGSVTYKEKGVSGATVTYLYEDGNFASGVTDSAGKFTVAYMGKPGGTVQGKVKVTVSKSAGGGGAAAPTEAMSPQEKAKQAMMGTTKTAPGASSALPSEIPAKYAIPTSSGLQTEVKASDDNDYPIVLTD